jgi:integrase
MKKSKIYLDYSELLIRKFESKDTINCYSNCGYNFIYDSHPDSIDKLSNDYLLSYITKIKERGQGSKYNQTVSVLKILYNELLNQESKLKTVKCIKIYPKLKTLPDITEVLNKVNGIKHIKHKAIILTLLYTGLRISELLNTKICDVDSKNMKILIENAKGGRTEFAILTDKLLKVLREYYKKCRPKEYLFEGLSGKYSKSSVNKLIKRYVGEKYSAHTMRHLAITYIINENTPLPKAKIFSRHKSNSAIEYYYHYDNSTFTELRRLLDKIA